MYAWRAKLSRAVLNVLTDPVSPNTDSERRRVSAGTEQSSARLEKKRLFRAVLVENDTENGSF